MPTVTISRALRAHIQQAVRTADCTQQALIAAILDDELASAREAHALGVSLFTRYLSHPDYGPVSQRERSGIIISAAHHREAVAIAQLLTEERGAPPVFAGQLIQAMLWTALVPVGAGERHQPPAGQHGASATVRIPDALYHRYTALAQRWGIDYQDTYRHLLAVGLAAVAVQGEEVLAPYPADPTTHLSRTVQVPRTHDPALQQIMTRTRRSKAQVVQALLGYGLDHASIPSQASRTLAIPSALYARLSALAARCEPPQVIDAFAAAMLQRAVNGQE